MNIRNKRTFMIGISRIFFGGKDNLHRADTLSIHPSGLLVRGTTRSQHDIQIMGKLTDSRDTVE